MIAKILFHGNCFDGLISTSIFRRFLLERLAPSATVLAVGMHHGPGDPYGADHDRVFDAELNAVLDFRYSPSPGLHWFCDHHESTFLRPEDRAHLEADRSGRKRFDPRAPSCAGLLVSWLASDHGFGAPLFEEHARWADLIDAARFESAAQAVELAEPALRLMALLESDPGPGLVGHLVEALSSRRLEDVAADDAVEERIAPVLEANARAVETFRRRLVVFGANVAFADLSEDGVEGYNKFIPYLLWPEAAFSVVVTSTARRAKVSVGRNPFARPAGEVAASVNIARLCGRFGGGGHAAVGAISLPPAEVERARAIAKEIAGELAAARGDPGVSGHPA